MNPLPIPMPMPISGVRPVPAGDGAARGGFILAEARDADPGAGEPDVVLVASGGEVPAALDARRILQHEGIATRVVSMPCATWFRQQSRAYRDTVLPPGAPATVSVGAGAEVGRYELLGRTAENAAPAPCDRGGSFADDGLTGLRVAAAARAALARATGAARTGSVERPATGSTRHDGHRLERGVHRGQKRPRT